MNLRAEIDRLRAENQRLRDDNQHLHAVVNAVVHRTLRNNYIDTDVVDVEDDATPLQRR